MACVGTSHWWLKRFENELSDFDDLPMDDLDGSNDIDENFVYGDSLPLEENIHQINEDLGYSRWTISNCYFVTKLPLWKMVGKHYYLCSVIIWNIMYVCGYMVLKLGTWKFEICHLVFSSWWLIAFYKFLCQNLFIFQWLFNICYEL